MTTPPVEPGPLEKPPSQVSGLEAYNRVAETVGMMPSFRKFDYIFQGSCVLVGALVGGGVGYFLPSLYSQSLGDIEPLVAAILGTIAGFIVMGVLSGLVLMVLGWVRAARR